MSDNFELAVLFAAQADVVEHSCGRRAPACINIFDDLLLEHGQYVTTVQQDQTGASFTYTSASAFASTGDAGLASGQSSGSACASTGDAGSASGQSSGSASGFASGCSTYDSSCDYVISYHSVLTSCSADAGSLLSVTRLFTPEQWLKQGNEQSGCHDGISAQSGAGVDGSAGTAVLRRLQTPLHPDLKITGQLMFMAPVVIFISTSREISVSSPDEQLEQLLKFVDRQYLYTALIEPLFDRTSKDSDSSVRPHRGELRKLRVPEFRLLDDSALPGSGAPAVHNVASTATVITDSGIAGAIGDATSVHAVGSAAAPDGDIPRIIASECDLMSSSVLRYICDRDRNDSSCHERSDTCKRHRLADTAAFLDESDHMVFFIGHEFYLEVWQMLRGKGHSSLTVSDGFQLRLLDLMIHRTSSVNGHDVCVVLCPDEQYAMIRQLRSQVHSDSSAGGHAVPLSGSPYDILYDSNADFSSSALSSSTTTSVATGHQQAGAAAAQPQDGAVTAYAGCVSTAADAGSVGGDPYNTLSEVNNVLSAKTKIPVLSSARSTQKSVHSSRRTARNFSSNSSASAKEEVKPDARVYVIYATHDIWDEANETGAYLSEDAHGIGAAAHDERAYSLDAALHDRRCTDRIRADETCAEGTCAEEACEEGTCADEACEEGICADEACAEGSISGFVFVSADELASDLKKVFKAKCRADGTEHNTRVEYDYWRFIKHPQRSILAINYVKRRAMLISPEFIMCSFDGYEVSLPLLFSYELGMVDLLNQPSLSAHFMEQSSFRILSSVLPLQSIPGNIEDYAGLISCHDLACFNFSFDAAQAQSLVSITRQISSWEELSCLEEFLLRCDCRVHLSLNHFSRDIRLELMSWKYHKDQISFQNIEISEFAWLTDLYDFISLYCHQGLSAGLIRHRGMSCLHFMSRLVCQSVNDWPELSTFFSGYVFNLARSLSKWFYNVTNAHDNDVNLRSLITLRELWPCCDTELHKSPDIVPYSQPLAVVDAEFVMGNFHNLRHAVGNRCIVIPFTVLRALLIRKTHHDDAVASLAFKAQKVLLQLGDNAVYFWPDYDFTLMVDSFSRSDDDSRFSLFNISCISTALCLQAHDVVLYSGSRETVKKANRLGVKTVFSDSVAKRYLKDSAERDRPFNRMGIPSLFKGPMYSSYDQSVRCLMPYMDELSWKAVFNEGGIIPLEVRTAMNRYKSIIRSIHGSGQSRQDSRLEDITHDCSNNCDSESFMHSSETFMHSSAVIASSTEHASDKHMSRRYNRLEEMLRVRDGLDSLDIFSGLDSHKGLEEADGNDSMFSQTGAPRTEPTRSSFPCAVIPSMFGPEGYFASFFDCDTASGSVHKPDETSDADCSAASVDAGSRACADGSSGAECSEGSGKAYEEVRHRAFEPDLHDIFREQIIALRKGMPLEARLMLSEQFPIP